MSRTKIRQAQASMQHMEWAQCNTITRKLVDLCPEEDSIWTADELQGIGTVLGKEGGPSHPRGAADLYCTGLHQGPCSPDTWRLLAGSQSGPAASASAISQSFA